MAADRCGGDPRRSELNRQIRALERLGEESRKALFFAASRRLMLDLMRGRTDTAAALIALAEETKDELPDGDFVVSAMIGYGGVQAGTAMTWFGAPRETRRSPTARASATLYAEIAWIYLGIGLLTTLVGSPRPSTNGC